MINKNIGSQTMALGAPVLGVPSGQNKSDLLLASSFLIILLCMSCSRRLISICCFFWYFIMMNSKSTMAPRKTPPKRALREAIRAPERMARTPPVMAPDRILLMLSSFSRAKMRLHSLMEQMPAQRAKLPAIRATCTCQHGSSLLHHHEPAVELLAAGGVVDAPGEVPHAPHHAAQREPTAQVVDDAVRAGLLAQHWWLSWWKFIIIQFWCPVCPQWGSSWPTHSPHPGKYPDWPRAGSEPCCCRQPSDAQAWTELLYNRDSQGRPISMLLIDAVSILLLPVSVFYRLSLFRVDTLIFSLVSPRQQNKFNPNLRR